MPKVYPLLSMVEDCTHPLGFSSLRNGSESVEILTSGPLFAVFEKNPVNLLNALEDMQGRPRTDTLFQHPYSLCVYYRKSLNPHGPRTSPIFIATLEFSPMTCRTTGGGLFGSLTGNPKRPAEAFLVGNIPSGRLNNGMHSLDMGDYGARELLADYASEQLGLSEPLDYVGDTSTPWDPEYTQ